MTKDRHPFDQLLSMKIDVKLLSVNVSVRFYQIKNPFTWSWTLSLYQLSVVGASQTDETVRVDGLSEELRGSVVRTIARNLQ